MAESRHIRRRAAWVVGAATAAAGAALAAPAGVASGEKTASDTINELQSQGYTVTIDRIGTGPMSDCVLTDVATHSRFHSGCRSSARYWAAAIGTF